ncbi:MAG: hypothetical protein QOK17_776 [Sphingomonadales bacterium]|nr:hypothetical protein [Sphingomonadales bacterium]
MGAGADEDEGAGFAGGFVEAVDQQEVAADDGGAASPGSRFGSATMAFAVARLFSLERVVLPFGAEGRIRGDDRPGVVADVSSTG